MNGMALQLYPILSIPLTSGPNRAETANSGGRLVPFDKAEINILIGAFLLPLVTV
jgi:hypothetical protein